MNYANYIHQDIKMDKSYIYYIVAYHLISYYKMYDLSTVLEHLFCFVLCYSFSLLHNFSKKSNFMMAYLLDSKEASGVEVVFDRLTQNDVNLIFPMP